MKYYVFIPVLFITSLTIPAVAGHLAGEGAAASATLKVGAESNLTQTLTGLTISAGVVNNSTEVMQGHIDSLSQTPQVYEVVLGGGWKGTDAVTINGKTLKIVAYPGQEDYRHTLKVAVTAEHSDVFSAMYDRGTVINAGLPAPSVDYSVIAADATGQQMVLSDTYKIETIAYTWRE